MVWKATGQQAFCGGVDRQFLAEGFRQRKGADARVIVLPEAQEMALLVVDAVLLTAPAAEQLEHLVVGAPAIWGFVDAAPEGEAIATAVFDDAVFGVEDAAIVADLAIAQRQPHLDLHVALLYQPGQQLGSQIGGAAIPGLHIAEGELGEQLAFEQLLSGKAAGECLEIGLAHEETRDQPDLPMALTVFCRQYQVLNAIENLQ